VKPPIMLSDVLKLIVLILL